MLTPRKIGSAGLILAVSAMAFAVGYLQIIEYLEPCPLCILDRAVVIALGVVFMIAILHNPARLGSRIYGALATLLSLTGIAICARHIWLQNLPADQVPECGAGFWFMLDSMPFASFLDTILNGSGECAAVQWQLFGLSIPELTMGLFILFLVLSVMLFLSNNPGKHDQTL